MSSFARLQGVRGVGSVERIGGVDREIRVGLDPDRLQAVGLTAADVSRQLRGTNVDLAGGRAEIGGTRPVDPDARGREDPGGSAATRIALPMGGEVRLDDLGTITDTIAEPRTFARLNGSLSSAFSILRAKGASDVTVAKRCRTASKPLSRRYPEVELKLIDSSVTYTVGCYDAAMKTLVRGSRPRGHRRVPVPARFAGNHHRSDHLAAVDLPGILGHGRARVSRSTWSACWPSRSVTGILVDDAIVEIENIVRHIRMGKSPYQAALEAADEIGLAVIAISLTIVAVFVPASFMTSFTGQFFKQFGITVSVQVLFSLLCARLITPMLAAYFLNRIMHAEKEGGRVMPRLYEHGRMVGPASRHHAR